MEKYLQNFYEEDKITLFRLKNSPDVVDEISSINKNHALVVSKMYISLVSVQNGQKNPLEMFKNGMGKDFRQFLELMGASDKQDTCKTEWQGFEVLWHLAPLMNSEQHRRLIGNIQCVIFLKEDSDSEISNSENNQTGTSIPKIGSQFDPSEVNGMGVVPQIFIVVERYSDTKWRLGFFRRSSLKHFTPELPQNYLFDNHILKDFILAKVHNGYTMSMKCPPINRLYETPRANAILAFTEKHCGKWVKGGTNLQ